MGFEPIFPSRYPTIRSTGYLYRRQDSNLQPLRSRRSIRPIGILLYFSIKELFRKSCPCCISQGAAIFLPSYIILTAQKNPVVFCDRVLLIEAYYASCRLNHGRILSLSLTLPIAVKPALIGT